MATIDEIRLQQLLQPFQGSTGIASLSQAQSPLSFRYQDEIYPQTGSSDFGYSIAPLQTSNMGFQGIAGTADDITGTGFPGSSDSSYPFAPANRLAGLNLDRFQGVSNDSIIDETTDDEQVEYLPGQYSFKDKVGNLINKSGISSLLGLITGNPILGLINKGIGAFANRAKPAFNDFRSASTGAQFFQNLRDRRAREEAAARGAAKQAELQRIQAMRAIRGDTGGGGNGGGIGSSVGGSASPGSAGPGGSDAMGSF